MSYENGWAAVNLEMTDRVARAEFDADRHWALVQRVTGIEVTAESPQEVQRQASKAMIEAWDYDFCAHALIHVNEIEACRTQMGHAVYADGGVDYVGETFNAFDDPEEALKMDPWEVFGEKDRAELVARFNEHYRNGSESIPSVVTTTGTYITLLTGAIYIFGWEMLLTMCGIDPEGFGEFLNRYRRWMQQYYDALAECDAPIIYSHDDIVWTSGAIFPPDWYRKYIFPNLTKLYEPLIAAGKKVLWVCDGDYTQFIDEIASTGVSGFFMEPLTDMAQIAEKYGKTHFFIGNADTRVLLSNDKTAIRAEVERCMAIGKPCPGFFMGVTNMIPPNTPVEAALYYDQCYRELGKR